MISGSGRLVKKGDAVFTITGTNTFSGGVTLSAGAIQVANSAALGTGTLVATGGRFSSDSGTARAIANDFSITGALTLGNSVNKGALTLNGEWSLGRTRHWPLTAP